MNKILVKQERNRGFSLMELLVVISIIAVLLSITMAGISSLGPAARLTNAGNEVVDAINRARQVARTQNSLTMVALIQSGPDQGRALATLVYSPAGGTWSQIDRWTILPDGIVIDTAASEAFFNKNLDPSIELKKSGQTVQCLVATFLPNGRPRHATAATQIISLKPEHAPNPPPNYYKIIVNQATGIPLVQRP